MCYDGRVSAPLGGGNKPRSTLILTTLIKGEPPSGHVWDHKDRDIHNNTNENLRLATYSQNQMNRGLQKNNTWGFKGLKRYKNKWNVGIQVNGKSIYVGRFVDKIEAAKAYNTAAIKYHGEFAVLNVIP